MSWRQPRAFALRLHASAAPPRGGLTQALGGKKYLVVVLSALQLIGFGQHCSSDGSSVRCFFGHVRCVRSHLACVTLASFGICAFFRSVFPLQILSFLTGLAESLRGALMHAGFGLSASLPRLHPRRLPSRLTSRSSRPRIVASATCLRYASTRPPPRYGAA